MNIIYLTYYIHNIFSYLDSIKETIPRPSLSLKSSYKSYFDIKTTSEKVKEVTPVVVENIEIKDQIQPIEIHSKEPEKEIMSIQEKQVKG